MAMIALGSRRMAPATLIGEVEGDNDDDRETFNTATRKQRMSTK